ncbi:MAG: hypothetical protein RRB24_01495 [Armatimonadota bacterium]|jgi:hypothetical protein|nr:hypothetical protein [Armatimonadota bacterium]MDT7971478.1 hypothetical protein [Armatimonadota bacterium]
MTVQERLQRLRLRKLECQRHLRVLEQKLAANPRDVFAKREMERVQALLRDLEREEQRLAGNQISGDGGREG